MKRLIFSILALSFIGFQACTSDPSTNTQNKETETSSPEKHKHYAFDTEHTNVRWIAFKFTERAAVKGTFKKIKVQPTAEGHGLSDALKGVEFSIPVSSIFSENEDRDSKLKKFFFGVMKDTDAISGTIGEFKGDDMNGNCNIILNMNGVSKSINFEYMITNNELGLQTLIDMNAWDGEAALASINRKCKDLHKGTDGKSVIWPEVKLQISVPFKK